MMKLFKKKQEEAMSETEQTNEDDLQAALAEEVLKDSVAYFDGEEEKDEGPLDLAPYAVKHGSVPPAQVVLTDRERDRQNMHKKG